MMPNQHVRKPDEVRTKEELLPLATDFIDQYYTSIKRQARPPPSAESTVALLSAADDVNRRVLASVSSRFGSKAHVDRLEEATKEIEASGTYQLKDTELIYGAKHAWRNAARCVGRIQWSKLQVKCREPISVAICGVFTQIKRHLCA